MEVVVCQWYDAGAVAREVAAAGLPAEFADKLVLAT